MCCGRPPSKDAPHPPHETPSRSLRRPRVAGIAFEYTGTTGLTVRGAVTGLTYRFDRPGARIAVDPRDVPSLVAVPRLRRI